MKANDCASSPLFPILTHHTPRLLTQSLSLLLSLSQRNKQTAEQVCTNFFFSNSSLIIALPLALSPSVVFSFSIIPWGRRLCGGNWQPSLHRLSARLLICMALIIDWSLQPQIYDGLSPPPSPSLIRSIFSPPPLNILPLHFPRVIKMHFSSIFLHSLSLDESTEPSQFFSHTLSLFHTYTNTLCALLSLTVKPLHLCFSFSSTC